MRSARPWSGLLLLLGSTSVSGCLAAGVTRDQETVGSTAEALTQANIVACTGLCAEAFGGKPSSKYPVYYALRSVSSSEGGSAETTVSAAFLMNCGANSEDAARAFGYDPRITSVSGIDRLEAIETVEALLERLGGLMPIALSCTSSPFFQVFRRIDVSHSAAAPAYYLQLDQQLVEDAVAKGGTRRPPAVYGLDCANPLSVLWANWASGQTPEANLAQAIPINAAVAREWTETRKLVTPTLFCGASSSYRTELPVVPPTGTKPVSAPVNTGAELYYVRTAFDGVSNASGAYYLISNGLGYAIDGCGANIGALSDSLGLPAAAEILDLSTSDPKFTGSKPNEQPVLRCDDARSRLFESTNAPKPYEYFSFGASDLSRMVRFSCAATERFFLGSLHNQQATALPEESLPYLSGSGRTGKVFEVGCAKEAPAAERLRLTGAAPPVLEIEHNGEWRGVCGHYFDIEEAEVACRQMGYLGVESFEAGVTKGAAAVAGSAVAGSAVARSASARAAAAAAEAAAVRAAVGMAASASVVVPDDSSLFWLDALNCRGTEKSIGACPRAAEHAQWGSHDCGENDYVTISCSTKPTAFVPVRNYGAWFINAAGEWEFDPSRESMLDAYNQGQWRAVCSDSFDMADAQVACRELGYLDVGSLSAMSSGTSGYWLDEVACTGSENRLSDCPHAPLGSESCSTLQGVRLVCDDVSTVPLRLTSSILEAYSQGEWRGVCDDSFDIKDAQVACKQLGYCSVSSFSTNAYAKSNRFWLDDLACTGDESTLSACPNAGLGVEDCGTSEHVKLKCDYWCSTLPLRNGDVLEAYYAGEWRGVCDDDFDMAAAQVACRQLGYQRAVSFSTNVETASSAFWIDDVHCSGNETSLSDCAAVAGSNGEEDCGVREHVRVVCE